MTENGSVETMLPDGSKRITRPGQCGFTTVFPDGRASTVSCSTQVPKSTPPLPDEATREWLNAHSEGLLGIARGLLGDDQVSINNYLRNHENPQQTIYDRIRIRTSFLSDLSASN